MWEMKREDIDETQTRYFPKISHRNTITVFHLGANVTNQVSYLTHKQCLDHHGGCPLQWPLVERVHLGFFCVDLSFCMAPFCNLSDCEPAGNRELF